MNVYFEKTTAKIGKLDVMCKKSNRFYVFFVATLVGYAKNEYLCTAFPSTT